MKIDERDPVFGIEEIQDPFDWEAWKARAETAEAELESLRLRHGELREMAREIGTMGCHDSNCVLDVRAKGMRTGGGCKCLTGYQGTPEVHRARRAVSELLRALLDAGSKGSER